MKKYLNIASLYWVPAAMLVALATSCNDLSDDSHYKNTNVENTNQEVVSTQQTVVEYIQNRPDLSKMSVSSR